MTKLTEYPLKIKLLLVPAIAVVSFVSYLIYSSLVLSGGDDLLKQIRNSVFPRLYAASENIKSFDGVIESLKTASATGETVYLESANTKASEILHRYEVLNDIDSSHSSQIETLKTDFNAFYKLAYVVAQKLATKTELPSNQQIKLMQVMRNAYSKSALSYRDSAEKEFQETIKNAIDNSERAQVSGATIGIFMLFVIGILTMLVNRGIVLLEKAVEDRNKELMTVNDELEHEVQNLRAAEDARNTAEAASHIKDEFLANMSHELRTPMNAVIGLSHLCLQTELSDKQQDYVQKINSSAKSLLGILNDILDISKIEAGKMELDRIPFELNEELENLNTIFGAKLQEKNVQFRLEPSPDIPSILIGDPLRLGQILINLTGNAVKFTSHGEVRVSVDLSNHDGDFVNLRFTVMDTGIGLSQTEIDKLFRPFTQADSSITRKFGGTGLGLTISKRLVELMGGQIWVKSTPDLGSKFIFTARFLKTNKQSLTPQTKFLALRGLRVLAVDKAENSLHVLKNFLESFSLDVTCAGTTRDAMSIVRIANKSSRPICLVVCNFDMPEVNGLEFARELLSMSELTIKPKVLVVTDQENPDLLGKFDSNSVDAVLEKPLQRNVLFDTISKILGHDNAGTGKFKSASTHFNSTLISQVRGSHLLLVEDNEINQQIAKEMLEIFEISVVVAENGEDAIARLSEQQFDGVLMDMQMPVMDGISATREIRKNLKWKKLPIIALTANVFANEKYDFLNAGMNDHIGKPIDPDDLLATLARWVRPSQTPKNTQLTLTPRTVPVGPLPVLPGVKVAESVRRIGGNVDLYFSLLDKFRVNQKDVVLKVRQALEMNDPKTAERLAHTLRGITGNLGAETLHKQAEYLENSIKNNKSEEVESLLAQVELEISSLILSVDQALSVRSSIV
jgi:polar amino acid transport system substrate-binding protein